MLGLERNIGSLEEGKRADLITVSLAHPNAIPLYNVYSFLVYAAKAGDVDDVFINGRQIVRSRKPLTLNPPQIRSKAEQYRLQIARSLQP